MASDMGDATRVIDCNGTDFPEALAGVPPGRYRPEPVHGPADEPGDEPGAEPDDFELTPEIEAKIEAGLADLRAGRTVSLEEADARMRARTTTPASPSRAEAGLVPQPDGSRPSATST
jgi:hypothetical protein